MTIPLDRRTRLKAAVRTVSPREFFGSEIGDLLARHGHLVGDAAGALAAPPLTVVVDDEAWTLVPTTDTVDAHRGTAAGAVEVTLTAEQFSDWAQDVRSLNAFTVAHDMEVRGGTADDILLWDSLWRCLLEGWPVVGDIEFLDRRGRPLDFERVFTPNDDPAELAHFVREAGFAHLRGWLDGSDVRALSEEIDRALPHYVEGDGRSWWARMEDGRMECVRMQEFIDRSPTTAKIVASDRWEQLRTTLAADEDLVQGRPGNKVFEALVKPVGVVAGASNLSFHRDCHLGGHPYGCSGVDVGITVTPSGPHNGQLRVVAGSHRIAIPCSLATTAPYLPVVGVPTEAGDLTIHVSCTLHESTAPVISTRKVMYAPFKLAGRPDDIEAATDRGPDLRDRVYEILLTEDRPATD